MRVLPLLVCLTTLSCACCTWAATGDEAVVLDQSERLQALDAVEQAPPDVLGSVLSYVLGGATVDLKGSFAADIAIDCPLLSAHVRTELSGAIQGNPSLAQAAVKWLNLNGPAGIITSLAVSQITPELLQKLGQMAPAKLDDFLGWLAGQSPRLMGEVAQKVMRSAGGGVLDLLLVVARKYPRVAARAVGYTARQCPRLLPRLMRLLVRKGPVTHDA
jgi:hypothetical protein